jgi:Domain of unknown function (DUF6285)
MNDGKDQLAGFLAAAEALLRDKVIAASTGEARFAGLMVASALGMAQREIGLEYPLLGARHDVEELAPQPSPFPEPAMALAHLIREGLMDGQDELFRRLLTDAVTRTAVTRPQLLQEREKRLAGLE